MTSWLGSWLGGASPLATTNRLSSSSTSPQSVSAAPERISTLITKLSTLSVPPELHATSTNPSNPIVSPSKAIAHQYSQLLSQLQEERSNIVSEILETTEISHKVLFV